MTKLLRQFATFLTGLGLLGCGAQTPPAPATTPAVQPPVASGPATIKPIDKAPPATEAMLTEFETKYACKLPQDYRAFLLKNNGGFPTPDCITFTEDNRTTDTDVFLFHAVGDERPFASLAWHLETYGHRLPKETLPIAHDSCGNLWLLNVGSQPGTVVFWDHGSFDTFDEKDFKVWPQVATSFQEFYGKLHTFQASPDEKKLISRYAMVQQAVAGMAKKDPSFTKHSVFEGAWHCDNRDGGVRMQYVEYNVHAVATHTDGYSLLRAQKGLTKSGAARLPK
jgi:hypothetical protein